MKTTNSLKVGDWVVTARDITKGKFQFGEISGFKFSKVVELDLDKCKMDEFEGGISKGKDFFLVLNKKELNNLLKLKTKLGVIEGLR